MRSLQPQNIPAAQQMRESGMSWNAIGRAFNVGAATVMRAVDPIHAERQRQYTRDSRARVGRAPPRKLDTRAQVVPKPIKPLSVWNLKSPEGRELGIRAITKTVTAQNGRGEIRIRMSLPYIPSIHAHLDRET